MLGHISYEYMKNKKDSILYSFHMYVSLNMIKTSEVIFAEIINFVFHSEHLNRIFF